MDSITTTKTAAKVGEVIHSYADAVRRHDDQEIDWTREELDVVRWQATQLGSALHRMQSGDEHVTDEQEIAQLDRLSVLHRAIDACERAHGTLPPEPDVRDPNYVLARDGTAEVVAYFLRRDERGLPDLTYLPQFADAMNVRIEFITRLHPHWVSDEAFRTEIEAAIERMDAYIDELEELVDEGFVITAECHPVLDRRTAEPVLEQCEVHVEDRGKVVATRLEKLPLERDPGPTLEQMQAAAVHDRDRLVRNRQILAVSGFERTRAVWRDWLREARSTIG